MKRRDWMPQGTIAALEALEEQERYLKKHIAEATAAIYREATRLVIEAKGVGDFEFDLDDFAWDCPDSPIQVCVYNYTDDPCHDSCIFCHDPEERK